MVIERINQYSEEQIASLQNSENIIRLIIKEQPDKHKLELLKRYVVNNDTAIQLCFSAVDNNTIRFEDFECLADKVVDIESYNRKTVLVSIVGISIFENLKELVISDLYDNKINLEELVTLKQLESFSLIFNGNLSHQQYDTINQLYSLRRLDIKGLDANSLDKLSSMEELICRNLKNGIELGDKMPNLRSIIIYRSTQILDLRFLLNLKNLQAIYLDGLSNIMEIPTLCSLSKLRRFGICNMKRLKQMPMFNPELESLNVENNVPMLGIDSFSCITPQNLPNLKWLRINLGSDAKSNLILDRFKNICVTTRW